MSSAEDPGDQLPLYPEQEAGKSVSSVPSQLRLPEAPSAPNYTNPPCHRYQVNLPSPSLHLQILLNKTLWITRASHLPLHRQFDRLQTLQHPNHPRKRLNNNPPKHPLPHQGMSCLHLHSQLRLQHHQPETFKARHHHHRGFSAPLPQEPRYHLVTRLSQPRYPTNPPNRFRGDTPVHPWHTPHNIACSHLRLRNENAPSLRVVH
mmetsp:Transcript_3675/g.5400  ORF Transcript_3675/g.5400 Transcript_3675/m.5400 type:complete len:205 (-) Transcript_3675:1254-1868(-)